MSIITTPLPYIFSNGTTADATQVNADLNTIVSGVNSNAAENGANASITSMSGLASVSHNVDFSAGFTVETSFASVIPTTGSTRWFFQNPSTGSGTNAILDLGNDTGTEQGELILNSSSNTALAGVGSFNLNAAVAQGFAINGTLQWKIASNGALLNPANTQPWGSLVSSASMSSGGSGAFITYSTGYAQNVTLGASAGTITPSISSGCAIFYATIALSTGGSGTGTVVCEFYDSTASAAVGTAIFHCTLGGNSILNTSFTTMAPVTAAHAYTVNATSVVGASVTASCLEFGIRVLG